MPLLILLLPLAIVTAAGDAAPSGVVVVAAIVADACADIVGHVVAASATVDDFATYIVVAIDNACVVQDGSYEGACTWTNQMLRDSCGRYVKDSQSRGACLPPTF